MAEGSDEHARCSGHLWHIQTTWTIYHGSNVVCITAYPGKPLRALQQSNQIGKSEKATAINDDAIRLCMRVSAGKFASTPIVVMVCLGRMPQGGHLPRSHQRLHVKCPQQNSRS